MITSGGICIVLVILVIVLIIKGGMLGIGLATSLGYAIPFFFCVAYFVSKKSDTVFRVRFRDYSARLGFEILRLGAPSGIGL